MKMLIIVIINVLLLLTYNVNCSITSKKITTTQQKSTTTTTGSGGEIPKVVPSSTTTTTTIKGAETSKISINPEELNQNKKIEQVFQRFSELLRGQHESFENAAKVHIYQTKSEVARLIKESKELGLSPDVMKTSRKLTEEKIENVIKSSKARLHASIQELIRKTTETFDKEEEKARKIQMERDNQVSQKLQLDMKLRKSKVSDMISMCSEDPGGCPLLKVEEAPISAHPYCDCEARVQQQETERTQYLDFYYNKFVQLRKCKGEFCLDCIGILNQVVRDLTSTYPKNSRKWCDQNYKLPNPHCEPFVNGFKLTSEGIKFAVSEYLKSANISPSCFADPKCSFFPIKSAAEAACKKMDCCPS